MMSSFRRHPRIVLAAALLGTLALAGRATPAATDTAAPRRSVVVADGTVTGETEPPRDPAAIRRAIRSQQDGTYIAEMLAGRDSALARWDDRTAVPVRVWIDETVDIDSWTPAHADQVRSAFAEWNGVGLPVRFVVVADSADAEVHVTWTDRFDEPISGRTRWARDDAWWITDGVITLAVHHHQGLLLDGDAVRAMALHEIGHLIGLDHTADLSSVMARRVRVRGIAPIDVATAELLYSVPPGRIR